MKRMILVLGMLAGCAAAEAQPQHATAETAAPKMRRIYDYCSSGCKDDACNKMCDHIFHGDAR